MLRLMKTINAASGSEARDEKQLETVFGSFWPKLSEAIRPKIERLKANPVKKERDKLETERILQELLILARQQMRILSSPDDLFGREVLSLLLRLIHEPDGAAIRLAGKERELVLALCGRWGKLEHDLGNYLEALEPREKRSAKAIVERFSGYLKELQAVLGGTATPDSIIRAFGSMGV